MRFLKGFLALVALLYGSGSWAAEGQTPFRLSRSAIFAMSTSELAEGYLDTSYKLMACAALPENGTLHIRLGGEEFTISPSNVDQFQPILAERLQHYEAAILDRGYEKLPEAFLVQTKGKCDPFDLSAGPALIKQDGFNLVMTQNGLSHRGVIVGSVVALEHERSPEVQLVGEYNDKVLDFRIKLSGFAAIARPAGCKLTLTHPAKVGPEFAPIYFERAITMLAQADYPKAYADLDEAIRLKPDFVEAFSVRAQLKAMAPDPRARDGQMAVKDATRACELTDWNHWQCLTPLAYAYAETGDFEAAVRWISKAIDVAPDAQRRELLQSLEHFKNREAVHFPQASEDSPPTESWSTIEDSPDTKLELIKNIDGNAVSYTLALTAPVTGKTYELWTQSLNNPPLKRFDGLVVDKRGRLAMSQNGDLTEIQIAVRDVVQGEPLRVWIRSTDGTIQARSKSVPYPLEASNEEAKYKLIAELVDARDLYLIELVGFDENEVVRHSVTQNGQTVELQPATIAKDRPSALLVAPAVYGVEGGKATVSVHGKRGSISIDLPWGRR